MSIEDLTPDQFLEQMRAIGDTGTIPEGMFDDGKENTKETGDIIDTVPNDTESTKAGGTETLGDKARDDEQGNLDSESEETTEATTVEDETDPDEATENETETEEEEEETEEEPTTEEEETETEDGTEETTSEETNDEDESEEHTDTLLEELSRVEFKVKGKTYKSLTDKDHLITAQKKALGYDIVAQKFAKVKPFVSALADAGLLEDPDSFNLVIEAAKGNKDAITKLLKDKEINPLELDVDSIDEEKASNNNLPNEIQLKFDDFVEAGQIASVDVSDITGNWDDTSVVEVLNNPMLQSALIQDKEVGLYDEVQKEIAELARVDYTGGFSKQTALEQYSIASQQVYNRLAANANAKANTQKTIPKKEVAPKKVSKKIVKPVTGVTKEKAEHVKKVASSSVSTKVVTTPKQEGPDISNMTNEEFLEFMRNNIND